MWIFTPNVAYNTDRYRCVWVGKHPDARLYFLPDDSSDPDYIQFDCTESAIRSFDALINGITRGAKSLLVQEVYDYGEERPHLKVEYDKEYVTRLIRKEDNETEIAEPRLDGKQIFFLPGNSSVS